MARLYLYLTRRDKRGVQVIATFQGDPLPPTRIDNLSLLRLPPETMNEINGIIHKFRQQWEPWLESADNFEVLRDGLHKRGYSNLPSVPMPLHDPSLIQPHQADVRSLTKKTSMVRKKI